MQSVVIVWPPCGNYRKWKRYLKMMSSSSTLTSELPSSIFKNLKSNIAIHISVVNYPPKNVTNLKLTSFIFMLLPSNTQHLIKALFQVVFPLRWRLYIWGLVMQSVVRWHTERHIQTHNDEWISVSALNRCNHHPTQTVILHT